MSKRLMKKIPGALRLAQKLHLAPDDRQARRFLLEMLPVDSVGAEIGVHLGGFSRECLRILSPKQLHLIDPWEHQDSDEYKRAWYGGRVKSGQKAMDRRYAKVCRKFAREIRAGQVTIHRGYSTDMLEQFDDGYLDWVYIDGNHMYEFVKADLELSFRKTKPHGYIAGDDYGPQGWWEGGVQKAVDEFAKRDDVELLAMQNKQFLFHKKL